MYLISEAKLKHNDHIIRIKTYMLEAIAYSERVALLENS